MTTVLTTKLNQILTVLVDYYIPTVYVIGVVSNILNIILFSRRKLRVNCCSLYFISLSLSQLFLLNVNCLLRMTITWSNYTGFSAINSLCKLRAYLNVLTLVLIRHFICLISIDRWLVTSTNISLQNISSMKNVRWIIFGSLSFWILFSIHAPIGYVAGTFTCNPLSDSGYAIFVAIYNIITSSGPFLILIIFSILTMINIRTSTRRVNQVTPAACTRENGNVAISSLQAKQQKRSVKKRRDKEYIRLAFLQSIFYLFFNVISSFSPIILYVNSLSTNLNADSTALAAFIHTLGADILYLYVSVSIFRKIPSRIAFFLFI